MHQSFAPSPADVRRLENLVRDVAEQIDAIRGEFTDAVWEAERVLRELREMGKAASDGEAVDSEALIALGENAAEAREGMKMSFSEAMSAARLAESVLTELRTFAAVAIHRRAA